MNYNDFPILNNNQYEFLNIQFLQNKEFNRKSILNEICNDLCTCKFSCFAIDNGYNIKIKAALKHGSSILTKLYENLTSTFSIQHKPHSGLKVLNIFELLNKINRIVLLCLEWQKDEPKGFYKTISQNTTIELLNISSSLTNALSSSNFVLFKHM